MRRCGIRRIVVAAALAAGVAAAPPAPAVAPAPARAQIVALGDSYTAGNGAGSYTRPDTGCHRSGAAYAERYAARLRASGADVATVWNVACSGAHVADLVEQLQQVPAAVARSAGLVLLPFFETFHPNRAGHQVTADLLFRRLG